MAANAVSAIYGSNSRFFRAAPDVAISHSRGVAARASAVSGVPVTKVINLNKFRKQKAKQTRVKQADTNRRLHGRTKAERAHDALQKKKLETAVDHARLHTVSDVEDDGTTERS